MKMWRVLSVFLCVLWSHLCDRGVQGDGCRTQHSGCCVLCNPGYFLNKKCGQCRPCPSNGYMDHPNAEPTCKKCQKCEGIFEYRSNCGATKNALCKCIAGKKCADEKCSQCEDNSCPAGTQLKGADCVNCPYGTFNPGWEGICRPWKNCSAINAVIYVNGTITSDVVCLPKPTKIPSTSSAAVTATTPQDVPSYNQSIIIVVISVVSSIIVFIVFFWCLSIRLERIKNTFMKIKQTEQEDACSCHYPEEEHGGEEETLSSEPWHGQLSAPFFFCSGWLLDTALRNKCIAEVTAAMTMYGRTGVGQGLLKRLEHRPRVLHVIILHVWPEFIYGTRWRSMSCCNHWGKIQFCFSHKLVLGDS